MREIRLIGLIAAITIIFIACSQLETESNNNESNEIENKVFKGEYCGQEVPDTIAKLFAPNFITTNLYTRDIAMMPDGKEIYFSVSLGDYNLIMFTKQNQDGVWEEPKKADFIKDSKAYIYFEPCISSDGKKMFFLSNMIDSDSIEGDQDIWCVDRIGDSWGEPYNIGEPINSSGSEFYPSLTKDGTMYFTRKPEGDRNNYIYRSRFVNGKYEEPEKLPEQVNCGQARYNAYISPDESFLIVPAFGMPDSKGATDYYITFRDENDNWSEPVNMGVQLNTKYGQEFSASLSPDGKYLFFMSDRENGKNLENISLKSLQNLNNDIYNGSSNIYWIDASIIDKLREHLNNK